MANLKSLVDTDLLNYYRGKEEAKVSNTYVAKEAGKGLSTNDYDATEKGKVAGAVQESDLDNKVGALDYIKEEDIEGTYAKSSDVESQYVKKDGTKGLSTNDYTAEDKAKVQSALQASDIEDLVDESALSNAIKDFVTSSGVESQVAEAIEELGQLIKLADDPVITSAQKATLKDTAEKGTFYIISDDNNHLSLFLGVGVGGADENGFYDTQTHVNLTGYATESYVDSAVEDLISEDDIKVAENSVIDAWFTA